MRATPIDIVVPVYNAAADLARCVDSVLEHSTGDWRLLLIDDASPDPAIRAYFSELRARRLLRVTLLANEKNIGFTLTANRGFAEARREADILLLNSDTVVTRGWLDRLSRCAASDVSIGTITPFSNNAEICSLPRFCANNPWPPGKDPESLVAALERAAVPTYPDLPTGVAFYLDLVRSYIAADPVRPLRELAASQQRVLDGPPHGILHLLHGHGGGTEYHVRALVTASSGAFRHYLLIAVGDDWRLEEYAGDAVIGYDFRRATGETWHDLLGGIVARFGIDLVHLHNISRCREAVLTALSELSIPYGYTVHDLNFACPTITFLDAQGKYCEAITDANACRACLAAQREFANVDIVAWREGHRAVLVRSEVGRASW